LRYVLAHLLRKEVTAGASDILYTVWRAIIDIVAFFRYCTLQLNHKKKKLPLFHRKLSVSSVIVGCAGNTKKGWKFGELRQM